LFGTLRLPVKCLSKKKGIDIAKDCFLNILKDEEPLNEILFYYQAVIDYHQERAIILLNLTF